MARFCQAGLAKWNALGGPAKSKDAPAAKPGLLTQLAGWLRQKLLPWLASAVIVLGGIVLALLWIGGGAQRWLYRKPARPGHHRARDNGAGPGRREREPPVDA